MVGRQAWCWEAEQLGRGPDWRMVVVVDPGDAEALAAIVARAHLPGYVPCGLEEVVCAWHGQVCRASTLMDSSSAAAYRESVSGEPRNIWIYNVIQTHANVLTIESGYGGRGPDHNRAETNLVLDLLRPGSVTLRHWSIVAGGDGYAYETLREGDDAASLLKYL